MVEGFPDINFSKGICQGCILGKHPYQKYEKGRAQREVLPLKLVHSDITVPFPTLSLINAKHVLNFIDDYSRFCWVYFLKNKSQVFENFLDYKASIENSYGKNIKVLWTCNGGEYVKKLLKQFCSHVGIQMQHTIHCTPQ